MNPTLTELKLIADSGLFVLVALSQFIIFPALHLVDNAAFVKWHKKNALIILALAGPLMSAQLIIALLQTYTDSSLINWTVLLLIISVWTCTYIFSIPCHHRLQSGKDHATISRLIYTNWPRTAALTIVLLIGLFL